jgi:hypothetical protein
VSDLHASEEKKLVYSKGILKNCFSLSQYVTLKLCQTACKKYFWLWRILYTVSFTISENLDLVNQLQFRHKDGPLL